MSKYDDIINLPHHVSKTRKPMSMESRASQFAPFSALNGYEEAIIETKRITEDEIEFNDDLMDKLNAKLQILEKNITAKPQITITYFVKDLKKSGGKYITETFNLRKIDKVKKELIMTNGKAFKFTSLIDISSDLF